MEVAMKGLVTNSIGGCGKEFSKPVIVNKILYLNVFVIVSS